MSRARRDIGRQVAEYLAKAEGCEDWLAWRTGRHQRTCRRVLRGEPAWGWGVLDDVLDALDLELVLVPREDE